MTAISSEAYSGGSGLEQIRIIIRERKTSEYKGGESRLLAD